MMLVVALLLLLFPLAVARQPTCAVLLCDETAHAAAWIKGAQDEFIVVLESIFGGFSLAGDRIGGCFDKTTILNSLVCLDRDDFPTARCYAKFCDFWRHTELFEKSDDDDDDDGCAAPSTHTHEQHHKQQRVCRTLQAWAAIGIEKLYSAFDAFDGGKFANATSFACVAEKLLRLVTSRLPPVFDDGASYRHQVLPAKLAAFDLLAGQTGTNSTGNGTTTDLLVGTRTVRSFRRAADAPAGQNHSLIATYVVARVLERSVDEVTTEKAQGGVTELLWPVSGSLASFDKTSLPSQTLCAVADQMTNLQAFDASRALPCLGPLDFAAVADEFARCRAFPSGRIRRYDDLSPAGCCSTIVLMADIDDKANGTRFEPRRESLAYVAHYRSSCTFEAISAGAAGNATSSNTTTSNTTTAAGCPANPGCPTNTGQTTINATCATRNVTGACVGTGFCSIAVFNANSNNTQLVKCGATNCTGAGVGTCSCAATCACLQQPAIGGANATFCVSTPTPTPPSGNAVVDPKVEAELVARVAAPDLCLDAASSASVDTSVASSNSTNTTTPGGNTTTLSFGLPAHGWRPPREGIPLTLAPGESRCVGGERAGAQCSLASECGEGRTCRLKPGTKLSFCYDRFAWSESEPCIYAGELTECPYGYCYGDADGHEGGAYPLLYVFRERNCGDRVRSTNHDECPHEVLNWFEHPQSDSVQ